MKNASRWPGKQASARAGTIWTSTTISRNSDERGDVILVRFPHPSGLRGKKRPAVVVQSDSYVGKVSTVVVAEITKNLSLATDHACLLIDITTPEGQSCGLIHNSVVSCLLLATIDADKVANVLGSLSPTMKLKLDDCLKAALSIS